jgi:hypothetical protein
MNWIPYPQNKPDRSGSYTISVIRKTSSKSDFGFTYTAHYDSNTDEWFKYDPFDDIDYLKEKITDNVTAWSDDNSVYMGYFGK